MTRIEMLQKLLVLISYGEENHHGSCGEILPEFTMEDFCELEHIIKEELMMAKKEGDE